MTGILTRYVAYCDYLQAVLTFEQNLTVCLVYCLWYICGKLSINRL